MHIQVRSTALSLAITLALLAVLLPGGAAQAAAQQAAGQQPAAQPNLAPATITLRLSPTAPQLGDRLTMQASVIAASGQPVASAGVTLLVDGQQARRAVTDAQGNVAWRLGRASQAGTYHAQAVLDGQQPAQAEQSYAVAPAQVEIHTAPALSGIQFTLDGRTFNSGRDGIARVNVDKTGTYSLTVTSQFTLDPSIRGEFAGWGDSVYSAQRTLQVPARRPLEAGFDMFYLVTPRFTEASRQAVDPKRVSSVTLASSIGRQVSLDGAVPVWLQGSRSVAVEGHLEPRPITYTVQSVLVDGANVVNQAQQHFVPGSTPDLPIDMTFYSLRISARDALFGYPIRSGLFLTYPDGQAQGFALGSDGQVTIDSLARGDYRVQVDGRGLGLSRQIVLSRDQDASIMVISYPDLVVGGGLLAALALSLLLFGRRFRRRAAASQGRQDGETGRVPEGESLVYSEE